MDKKKTQIKNNARDKKKKNYKIHDIHNER